MNKRLTIGSAIAIPAVMIISIGTLLWFRAQSPPKQAQRPAAVTQPKQTPPAATPSFVDQTLKGMSLRDKVASLFILHTPGTNVTTLTNFVETYKPGGFILMGDNFPSTLSELAAQNSALIGDKKLPLLLATDEEGDTVKRLAADTYPGALTLPYKPPAATKDAFAQRSDLLKSVNINLNFGIIADVTADPASFIYPRVLGTTAQAASERVEQAVIGSKNKTLSTLKHFPGHGETPANSHTTIPTILTSYDDWRNRVALPFKAGIDTGADLVMFGHLRYQAVDTQPAILSKNGMT